MARIGTRRALLYKPVVTSVLPVSGAILWLDFSDAATMFTDDGATQVSGDGDAVYRVNDKSASGYVFRQSVSDRRPLHKTNRINSRSTVLFQGGDDALDNTTFNMDMRYRTSFVVFRENTTVAYSAAFVIKPAAGDDYNRNDAVILATSNTTNQFEVLGSSGYDMKKSGSGATPLAIYVERKTTGRGDLYVGGGTAVASDTVFTEFAAASGGGALVGQRFVGGAVDTVTALNGDICEIIIYPTQLSAADTNLIGAAMATKWGLTWTDITA